MISVCIPVYNYNIAPLLKALYAQVATLKVSAEILVMDDASTSEFRQANSFHKQLADQYIELPENIGRAAIRNRFLEYANYRFLLFMDCDCMPQSDRYLARYASVLHPEGQAVWCGGRVYQEERPPRETMLRWTYGRKIESQPSVQRSRDPYRSFHTNNFIVRRELLEKFPFDESLRGYGHEDTMFGFVMKQNGIPIVHIDNPVVNMHLETNERFLQLTDEGLTHLQKISRIPGMTDHVRLLGLYEKVKASGLSMLLQPWLLKPLSRALRNGYGTMGMLQLYKLLRYEALQK